ncbi:hypothetical protein FQR65_LT14270 [Abscondita terminalis]|nr:hypothetical protein FQR65_LT14270 [Abscondita terminalis]
MEGKISLHSQSGLVTEQDTDSVDYHVRRCTMIIRPLFSLSLITLLAFAGPVQSLVLGEVLDVISVGKDIVVSLAKAWNIVEDQIDQEMIPPFLRKSEKKLFEKIGLVQLQLDRLDSQIGIVGINTINSIINYLPERIKFELRLHSLMDYITRINVFYKNMNYYTNHSQIEQLTLEDFAKTVTSHDSDSVRSLLERIHAFVVPDEGSLTDTGIINWIGNLQEAEGDMLCNTDQSPHQILYNLYNTIEVTELKGYIMMQFSYMLLKLYNKGNFSKEAEIMKDRYQERTKKSVEYVKKAMEKSSRHMWKCDPKQHILNETYIEVTQLLQGYIQNEVDLNPKGTCSESCSEYTYTKSHSCFKNLYCNQQRRCNGKIINCRYVDSDMWVCPAEASIGRRYEYIEYENGRVLGRKQGCRRGTVKVDSWWRWLFWHCSYCFCLCDEQGVYSDRYFNMRSVIADIKNNRVVTGLRFVKKNRIIHLQIQEGKLLPQGKIDPTTVRWVQPEDYRITDRYIYNGQDYHTLTWEQRSIDLDDLPTDDGYILTGVRFKKIGTHLNFEIYMSLFDFDSGKLKEPIHNSVWKDNSNTDVSFNNPRTQLHLRFPDVPTRLPISSKPDSKSDQYVEMTHTDFDRDAAQTTVPFFDAQPVAPSVPVPLAGAGIYHKGGPNSGGFIAPKVITYDFGRHLNGDFPEYEVEAN